MYKPATNNGVSLLLGERPKEMLQPIAYILCESGVEMTDKLAELVEFSCDGKSTDSTVCACLSRLRYSI